MGRGTAVEMMKAGASDYLMKGNLTRLAPAIERELREAEVRRERRRGQEQIRLANIELVTGIRLDPGKGWSLCGSSCRERETGGSQPASGYPYSRPGAESRNFGRQPGGCPARSFTPRYR